LSFSKAKSITILIDMDAVLVDILGTWLPLINKDYNENLTADNLTDWNVTGCAKNATHDQIMEYLYEEDFFANLKPIDGAIEVFKKLYEEGFNIWIVTAPPYDCKYAFSGKLEWIEKHLPFFPKDKVIFTRHKGQIKGNILFDDAPHNLNEFPEIGVAMDYAFNKSYLGPRVKNWNEFYRLVHNYCD
jgi:5'-nucleotidase